MIRFLFIDLDDTILDFGRAESIAVSKTLVCLGVEPTDAVRARYSELNRLHWQMLERGELVREQVKVQRFAALFRELGRDVDAQHCARIYEDNLSVGHYFLPGAEETLRALSRKYRLFLASNGTARVQAGRLSSTNLRPMFEDVFISEEIGHNKPAKAFFEACFDRIVGFDRAECMIVGDSLTSDILGGINAGIKTCWVNPEHHPRSEITPDYEIEALTQLPELLESINALPHDCG